MENIAQIIAFIAFILFVLSIQMKEKKKLVIYQLFANLLYGISYFLLNSPVAFIMNMVSVLRCLILYFSKGKPSKLYLFLLILIIINVGIFMYDTPLSLIPICITLLYTISTWQDDMRLVRYLFVTGGIFWTLYNYSAGAYIAIMGNIFEIISGSISIIRYKKKSIKTL